VILPMKKETTSSSNFLYPALGAALAGLVGSAEIGRRLFRRSQLFRPEREPVLNWNPRDYGLHPDRVEELSFNGSGVDLYGWYCRAESPVASFLFCHGQSGNLTWTARGVADLVEAGFNVFTFDYRGYGRSSGRPTIRGVVRDAIAAANEHDRLRPPEIPSIMWGYSLGGAIGAQAFVSHDFEGLVLQSTFTTLRSIARSAFPDWPLHLLAGSIFDTVSIVRELDVPVLIIHGEQDETVPLEMGQLLHESCASSEFEIIRQGSHLDLFEVAGPELCRITEAFVNRVLEKRGDDIDPREVA
jgi:uncharacterized protein